MGLDSVQYQFLMAFSLSRTIPLFCGYFSHVHIGMVLPNFACIPMTPSLFSTKLRVASVLSSELSKRKHVLLLIPENWIVNRMPAGVAA